MTAARQIKLRRVLRHGERIVLALLLCSSLLDHTGAFGYRGDDWRQFDRRKFTVAHIIDDESFDIGGTVVRLLGVGADEERVTSYVQTNLEGQRVILRLDVPQTRDAAGELLAYVYLSPSDCWYIDLIRNGSGYADRQSHCSLLPTLIAAEDDRERAIRRSARRVQSNGNARLTTH